MVFSVLAIAAIATVVFPRNGSDTPEPFRNNPASQRTSEQVLPTPSIVVRAPYVGSSPPAADEAEPLPELDPMPFFVSPTIGDDANDGTTIESPWASLDEALERIGPGETLYLMDGTYSELGQDDFHYLVDSGGTEDAWVRITAAPGHTPVLVATDGTALEVRANYVEVSGLTVRGEGFDVDNSWGVGLGIRRAHHVRIIGNTVSNMPLSGISTVESSNLEIIDNEVFENSFWHDSQGSGISIWHSVDWGQPAGSDGYHDRIIGNRVYRNENRVLSKWNDFTAITDGNGIIIDENRDFNYSGRTLVANNVIFDNGGRGIHVFKSNRVDVVFNSTYRNGRTEGLSSGPSELSASNANDVRFINNLSLIHI